MENIINKAKNAVLVSLGLIMAVGVATFGFMLMGGMLMLGLLAIPVGALALLCLPKSEVGAEDIHGQTQTV